MWIFTVLVNVMHTALPETQSFIELPADISQIELLCKQSLNK